MSDDDKVDKKTFAQGVVTLFCIGLIAWGAHWGYSKYKNRLCEKIAVDATAEQKRDTRLGEVASTYCLERRKSSSVSDCKYEIMSVQNCSAEVQYKMDKVATAGSRNGCLQRTLLHNYNPVFNDWSEGERLSQETTKHGCDRKITKRKRGRNRLRDKARRFLNRVLK